MERRIEGGLFITLEGIEGAGKSTAQAFLAEWLVQRGYAVCKTREPGGSPLGEALRGIFLDPEVVACPDAELLLIYASRVQHLRDTIMPALARGEVVLCDRFEDSTFAYQGGGRGVPFARIEALSAWAGIGRHPDLTIWLDLTPELGRQRAATSRPDRMEREGLPFFARARDAFRARWEAEPARIERVEADADLETVRSRLVAVMERRLCGR